MTIAALGFDPGLKGGCALIDEDGFASVIPMPVSGGEIDGAKVYRWILSSGFLCLGHPIACVESVHAMPKQGVSSTFTFGKGYGTILGVLAATGLRVELVTPQKWKGVVLAGTAKDKDAAVAWCRRAYPKVELILPKCRTPHDGIADAMAIAEYARCTY